MDRKFKAAVDSLHPKYEALIQGAPHKQGAKLPLKGVYLFSEDDRPIYVGRSDNILRRFQDHRSSATNKAALARLMACKELGLTADYKKGRDKFKNHPGFSDAFKRARNRIRAMSFRSVQEDDPTRQALLEVYCAVAAQARFNDFRNH